MNVSILALASLALTVAAEASAAPSCVEAFTKDFSTDAQAIQLSADDVKGLADATGLTIVTAKNAVKAAAAKLGCDQATLHLFADRDDSGKPANRCTDVIPGNSLSRVCYITTNDSGPGFFFVHATLPDGVTVSFSRWD